MPEYICEIARAIARGGKDLDSAIPIAVSRCKVWATGKGVDSKTQAKAAAAVAEWEAKKARADAKSGSKDAGKAAKIAASEVGDMALSPGEELILLLTVASPEPRTFIDIDYMFDLVKRK